jgi:N-methylhydantoinase A
VTFRLEAIGAVRHADLPTHPLATTEVAAARIGTRDVWLAEAREFVPCAVYDRERLGPAHRIDGPAIVEQMDATTLLLPEQTSIVDPHLNLIVEARRS